MYKLKDGWTKAKIMEKIKKYNNGSKSWEGNSNCVYQTKTGNRCAIGCFIPDNHPGLNYEGDVLGLLETYPSLKEYMPFDEPGSLRDFQQAHDTAKSSHEIYKVIEYWIDNKIMGLKVNV